MQVATRNTTMISGPSGAWINSSPSTESYLKPIYKHGDVILEVECGSNKGLLYLSRLCQGSRGPSILFENNMLTPNEFQFVSGRETAKDWKRSIRHYGKSIKLLLSKGLLCVHPTVCDCMGCKTNGQMGRGRSTFRRSPSKSRFENGDQNDSTAHVDSPSNQNVNDKLNTSNDNQSQNSSLHKNKMQRSSKLTEIIEQLRSSREKENVSERNASKDIKTEPEEHEERKVVDYSGKIHFKEIQRRASISPIYQPTIEELNWAISYQKEGAVSPQGSPNGVTQIKNHPTAMWNHTQLYSIQSQLSQLGTKRPIHEDSAPLDLTIKKKKTDDIDISLTCVNSARNELDLRIKMEVEANLERIFAAKQHSSVMPPDSCNDSNRLFPYSGDDSHQSKSSLMLENYGSKLLSPTPPITPSSVKQDSPKPMPTPSSNNCPTPPSTNSQCSTVLSFSTEIDDQQKGCSSPPQLSPIDTSPSPTLKVTKNLDSQPRGCPSPDSNIDDWSIEQVANFVQNEIGCEEYSKKFKEQHVDGKSLLLLTVDHLVNVVGMKLGPAVRIRAEISKLTGKCESCQHCLHCHRVSAQ